MGNCIECIHLTVTVEAIIASAALASGKIATGPARVEGIWWTINRVRRAGKHSLDSSLWHLAELADDQSGNASHMRRSHGCALGVGVSVSWVCRIGLCHVIAAGVRLVAGVPAWSYHLNDTNAIARVI